MSWFGNEFQILAITAYIVFSLVYIGCEDNEHGITREFVFGRPDPWRDMQTQAWFIQMNFETVRPIIYDNGTTPRHANQKLMQFLMCMFTPDILSRNPIKYEYTERLKRQQAGKLCESEIATQI
jgi:hypothetical protein